MQMTTPTPPPSATEEMERLLEEYDSPKPRYPFSRDDCAHKLVPVLRETIRTLQAELATKRDLERKLKIAMRPLVNHHHLVRGECIAGCDLCQTLRKLSTSKSEALRLLNRAACKRHYDRNRTKILARKKAVRDGAESEHKKQCETEQTQRISHPQNPL